MKEAFDFQDLGDVEDLKIANTLILANITPCDDNPGFYLEK